MIRSTIIASACLLAVCLSGCTSLLTARAIESFTTELAAGNLTGLESATSSGFRERALRGNGALQSLQYLPLPREEGEVTEVEEIGPDERILTVLVGEPPQTVKYRLKREAAGPEDRSPDWKVDDVILTRERGEGKPPLTKSITEQMDVLLTAQEFMTSWQAGSREETLALLHPELRERMASLSAVHLAQITSEMLAGIKDETFRPEAKIQAQHAVVLLPCRAGKLQLDLEPSTDSAHRWAIRDVTSIPNREGEPQISVAHLAGCVGRATDFLNAYEARDLPGLQQASTDTFYSQTLATADFDTVTIPVPQILASRYEIEEQEQRTDLMFYIGDDTYLISMTRDAAPDAVLPEQRTTEPLCQVEEVTIYERGGAQIKPLSVVFSAQAVVEVFAEAVASRDLELLSQLSTTNFNTRVWNMLASNELIRALPFEGLPSAAADRDHGVPGTGDGDYRHARNPGIDLRSARHIRPAANRRRAVPHEQPIGVAEDDARVAGAGVQLCLGLEAARQAGLGAEFLRRCAADGVVAIGGDSRRPRTDRAVSEQPGTQDRRGQRRPVTHLRYGGARHACPTGLRERPTRGHGRPLDRPQPDWRTAGVHQRAAELDHRTGESPDEADAGGHGCRSRDSGARESTGCGDACGRAASGCLRASAAGSEYPRPPPLRHRRRTCRCSISRFRFRGRRSRSPGSI